MGVLKLGLAERFTAFSRNADNHLDHQWRKGSFVYGSDGRIAVRVDVTMVAGGFKDVSENDAAHKLTETIDSLITQSSGIPIDIQNTVLGFANVKCEQCNGSGRLLGCDECTDGEFEHGSHTYTCMNCDGSAHLPFVSMGLTQGEIENSYICTACKGTCKAHEFISIEGVSFPSTAIRIIPTMPSVTANLDTATSRLYFEFEGGRGVALGSNR